MQGGNWKGLLIVDEDELVFGKLLAHIWMVIGKNESQDYIR